MSEATSGFKRLYTATATASGQGRQGEAITDDARLKVGLSVPQSLGGDDGPGTNPEQLFACGYAACFHSALRACARLRKLDVGESLVKVQVNLLRNEVPTYRLAVRIEANLPTLDMKLAQELIEAAHALCPYSNATRGNVDVELVVA